MEHLGQFIINHWLMWAAGIVILLLIFVNELISQKKRPKELSPGLAIDMINNENAVVVDLRDADAYRSGHIIDAIRASTEDFEQAKMEKYQSKPLILVCAKGQQSPVLANKLRNKGYTQPMILSGGIAAWTSAGLPLVKGK